MSYNIPITQIYFAKTHGKVNVNINVTDKPLHNDKDTAWEIAAT